MVREWRATRWVTIKGSRTPESVRALLTAASQTISEYVDRTGTPFDERAIDICNELDRLVGDVL